MMIQKMMQQLFPEPLDAIKDPEHFKVFNVVEKLLQAVIRAQSGQISYAQVFNSISIRDCLSSNMILATTWHIDDLRDKFPEDTPDDVLNKVLHEMEDVLSDAAVSAGWEMISYFIDSFLDQK